MGSYRTPALGVGKCSLRSPRTTRADLGVSGSAQRLGLSGSQALEHTSAYGSWERAENKGVGELGAESSLGLGGHGWEH